MSLPTSDQERDRNVMDLLVKCESSIRSKNFEEAINSCRAILTLSPENQRARDLLDEAQSKLEAQIFTKENLRKAQEFFKIRDFQKCINECQKIQLLDADNPTVMELLQQAHQKLEAEPFVQNFINSGRSLFDSGLYDEAVSQWEKVRAIDPDYPDLDRLINNARAMISGAKTEVSTPIFDALPEPMPESVEAFGFVSDQDRIRQLLQEGDQCYAGGEYQKAIEIWSEIFMLDVNHPEALRKIEEARSVAAEQRLRVKGTLKNAQLAYEQGDISVAQDLFREVLSTDPENAEAQKYIALMDRADSGPVSLEDLLTKGNVEQAHGRYREAAQYLSQALAVDSENAELADRIKDLNLLAKKQEQTRILIGNARGFVAEGKLDSARHALSKILETDPANQEALTLLQELKDRAASGSSPAVRAALLPAHKRLPLVPAAVVGAAVIAAAIAYFVFFQDGSSDQQNVSLKNKGKTATSSKTKEGAQNASNPSAKTGGKNAASQPKGTKQEQVERLLKESNFYYAEKHYAEAIQKADEVLKLEPNNKDAIGLKLQSEKMIQDLQAAEFKILDDANRYFDYSEFAGAVRLYEKYLGMHPEMRGEIMPKIIKCYYNLGVVAVREWRCDVAGDYFRQVLFIDETDQLSKDALAIARRCQKSGNADIDVRKAVALMEIRR